ncbi:unnamed protein product [Peniophora sp. CBMAI 1063]|nr:unnamed protein product [Peniophora sp. CBMAI 1063]
MSDDPDFFSNLDPSLRGIDQVSDANLVRIDRSLSTSVALNNMTQMYPPQSHNHNLQQHGIDGGVWPLPYFGHHDAVGGAMAQEGYGTTAHQGFSYAGAQPLVAPTVPPVPVASTFDHQPATFGALNHYDFADRTVVPRTLGNPLDFAHLAPPTHSQGYGTHGMGPEHALLPAQMGPPIPPPVPSMTEGSGGSPSSGPHTPANASSPQPRNGLNASGLVVDPYQRWLDETVCLYYSREQQIAYEIRQRFGEH